LQAQIATAIGTGTVYDTDGTTVKTAGSGGTFWTTPKGYAGYGVDKPGTANADRGTLYGSGSSVFTQSSTSATA
jgi:hypothetical protein